MWKRYAAVALTLLVLTAIPASAAAQAGGPPPTPTGVSVSMALGRVVIQWDSPSNPSVSSHRVYRQTAGQEQILAGETQDRHTTSLTDAEGQAGQTLIYRVTALGPSGESERSDPASITLRPKPIGTTATAFHPTTGEEAKPSYQASMRRPVDHVRRGDRWSLGWITRITAPAITWQGNVEDLFRRSTHQAMIRIYRMLISIILNPP